MNPGSGKTALITGASSGIGQELAKLFAKDGYNLILVARGEDKLRQLADEFQQNHGVQTTIIQKDLSEEDAAQDVYNQVVMQGLTVDILVNDAGVGLYGMFATETDWDREKAMIHLNVLTTTQMTKLFLKDMVARNEGKILNLASLVSITPMPLMAVYAATKAYVYNFTQSLINELKDTNISVTALLPNATDTDFFNKAGATDTKVTDQVDDPAMVARDGYKALMEGSHKVIPGGFVNKAYEIITYVAPQEANAAMMRYNMTPKSEVEADKRQSSGLSWGLGIAALALAGVALAMAYNNADLYDKARYRYKAGRWRSKAGGAYDDAKDAVTDGWENVKKTVSSALA